MERILNFFSIILLVAALAIGSKTEIMKNVSADNPNEAIENQPMIDKDAVTAYRNGEITKTAALLQIDARLSELEEIGAIKGWVFYPDTDSYGVILNNNAVYSYNMN